uniref:TGF-beta family profile domain-containing protein n=1 Tax=Panagrolaimus sp. JU765 TaxID=591449 RepID=A0AC34RH54_9BILA
MYGIKHSFQDNTQNIPFYIWDFYDRAKDGELELVRHYLPQHVIHDSNPETQGWFVIYNLTATGRKPENELVVKADLRLRFGKEIPTAEEYRQRTVIQDDEEDEPALMTTSWEQYNIYEVDPELREVRRLLDSRFIPEDSLRRGYRWIDFDVTASLSRRRRGDNQETVEYYVERVPADHVPMFIDLRESAALIVQIETPSGTTRHRSKREAKRKKGKKRKQHHSMPKANDLCRLESLWIDFKDLDWDGWIISPSGYQAQSMSWKMYRYATIRQTKLHKSCYNAIIDPFIKSKCCSSTIDQRNITVVHSYPQMIVDACGCH